MTRLLYISLLLLTPVFVSQALLGSVNIELHTTVVNYSCSAAVADKNKIVSLGSWATRDLTAAGSYTAAVAFGINLNDCPPNGSVSITFSGVSDPENRALLALSDNSTAKNVAVEILDSNRNSLPLNSASRAVKATSQGSASFIFYARYFSVNGQVSPGAAKADATMIVNYE